MSDTNLLEWLVDEAEEALEFEGLLMLYELSWSLRGQDPSLSPGEVQSLSRRAYDEMVSRHPLRLVWVSWPHKEIVGDATGVPPSFEIDDERDLSKPLLALVPE